jgi:hypothetical protein
MTEKGAEQNKINSKPKTRNVASPSQDPYFIRYNRRDA